MEFYVPQSFLKFVRENDDFRDFRKAAPVQYYYDREHIPPTELILNFVTDSRITTYSFDSIDTSDFKFNKEDIEKEVKDAVSHFYPNLPAYDNLIDILVDELGYLFTSSFLLATKEKISETVERVNGTITKVGSKLQEPALEAAVTAQSSYWEHRELFGEKIKLGIFAVPLGMIDVQITGGAGSVGYLMLRNIIEDTISNRLIVAIDP